LISNQIAGWEIALVPIYLIVIFGLLYLYPPKEDKKLFMLGLGAKILGSLGYVFIYLFYYGGGDTISYYNSAIPFLNLIQQSPFIGIEVFFDGYSPENFSFFSEKTGYPLMYIYIERNTALVSKIVVPFLFLSFKSYLLSSILIASTAYLCSWKLFQLFRNLVPSGERIAAFSTLFFPSALFWGSGISKDTVTYASMCYVAYGIYWLVIKRRITPVVLFFSIVTAYFILTIKAYIFIVLIPGALLWIFNASISEIRNRFIRLALVPFTLIVTILLISFVFTSLSDVLGDYSSDKIIQKAIVTQEDLKRDYYGGNSFDIGTIEPSTIGVLSKLPIALFYGFFGPTLVHVKNVVMLLSAFENTFFLVLTLLIFVFRNPLRSIKRILDSPLLTFCLMFSVLLGFGIGLTTANFGALVRFKIPLLPFFSMLLLTVYFKKETLDKPKTKHSSKPSENRP
jgi:hypothetical protein